MTAEFFAHARFCYLRMMADEWIEVEPGSYQHATRKEVWIEAGTGSTSRDPVVKDVWQVRIDGKPEGVFRTLADAKRSAKQRAFL